MNWNEEQGLGEKALREPEVRLTMAETKALVQAVMGDRFDMRAMNDAMKKMTDALDAHEATLAGGADK